MVRALGPRYARVIGLDKSGLDEDVQEEGRRDEELAYEELLLGMEVSKREILLGCRL